MFKVLLLKMVKETIPHVLHLLATVASLHGLLVLLFVTMITRSLIYF